mmetsp:Transcript_16407/g.38005  ORF Transcript_16407/g.38005 Transcript_16407/m.38005 type:complete len:292 (+) Transcript_16407:89-964(+)
MRRRRRREVKTTRARARAVRRGHRPGNPDGARTRHAWPVYAHHCQLRPPTPNFTFTRTPVRQVAAPPPRVLAPTAMREFFVVHPGPEEVARRDLAWDLTRLLCSVPGYSPPAGLWSASLQRPRATGAGAAVATAASAPAAGLASVAGAQSFPPPGADGLPPAAAQGWRAVRQNRRACPFVLPCPAQSVRALEDGQTLLGPAHGDCHIQFLAPGQLMVSHDLARRLAPDHPPKLPAFAQAQQEPGGVMHQMVLPPAKRVLQHSRRHLRARRRLFPCRSGHLPGHIPLLHQHV